MQKAQFLISQQHRHIHHKTQLMLFKVISPFDVRITGNINTLCGPKAGVLNVKVGGTQLLVWCKDHVTVEKQNMTGHVTVDSHDRSCYG
jgi:hypothetical protein